MNDSNHKTPSPSEALDRLSDYNGDTYMMPPSAQGIVEGLAPVLEDYLADDHDAMQDGALWGDRYVGHVGEMAMDNDGFTPVAQYRTVVLAADLSEQLAEHLSVEPGEGKSIGSGRRKREAHEQTVVRLRDRLKSDGYTNTDD